MRGRATTRPRRDNEVDGQDYHFITPAEFDRRLAAGEFLEHAKIYGGQNYGTPAGPVSEALETGRVVILEIDIEGTLQVARRYPDAIGIYILAPTAEEQQGRLVMRLTSLHFLGVPCPAWLRPQIVAEETGEGDTLHFHVQATVPWVGQVVHYRGHLVVPDVVQEVPG